MEGGDFNSNHKIKTMKRLQYFFVFIMASMVSFAQTPCQNGFAGPYPCNDYDLMSHITLSTMSAGEGNDSWGWTDPSTGKEYAIIGLNNGTAFIDISDPVNAVYLGKLPTATSNSSWRDVKVYNNHAFIVSEAANHGMQVFDLTRLRNVTNPPQTFTADTRYTNFGNAHNIVINESSGYAFAVGTSTFNGGPHFVNIQNPTNPVAAGGYAMDGYSHDAQVITYSGPDSDYTGREMLIGSNENEVVIVDITDKTNPVTISTINYPNVGYTHQGWFTEDERYFILGDELDETNIGFNTRTIVFDFQDLDNPQQHMIYTGPTAAIDHNGYVKGDLFYLANYRAGVRIIDVATIGSQNMTEVGYFDTYPSSDSAAFNGVWNVYPYFDSGNIVLSDIEGGFFLIKKSAGGGGGGTCTGTESAPYNESFESSLGVWVQSTQDDLNWTRDSGGTPSNNTGPSSGSDGSFYVFVEASGNGTGYPNKRAILNSPCFDLATETEATFNFDYHMFGAADMGSIALEASIDNGSSWTSLWSQTGNQGNQWNSESISLNAYVGGTLQLRFNRLTGGTWQADIALDGFSMQGGSAPDTEAPSVPTGLAASNIADTTLTLTWNASTDNVGVTGYEVFQDGSSIGTTAGTTYNVTGLTAATAYAFTVRAFDAAGNNSGQSNTANATTTGGGGGCTGGVSVGYSEGFESSIGAWTQASGDDLDWTRDSGGTPSSNTGPSSGSGSTWYMYVEASGNGTGYPNKRAILNSPCIDLGGETEADFTFDYHMFGATDMGSIALEASTDGSTWVSLWSQTGNQGNQWNSQAVSLDAYAGGTVELRFNRVTGSTWQADIAIDNVGVTSGGGGGNPPTGYCASNGNNTSDEYIQRVQLGSIDNSTGASAGGYGDFTSQSTNLSASNSITITPLWTGTVYNEAYAVFVDWNRDGDFGDANELAYSQAPTTATSVTGTITVPAGASAGPTRMRVSMKYNGIPTACESFQWGEVEDYIVVIPSSIQTTTGNTTVNAFSTTEVFLSPNPVNRGVLNVKIQGANGITYRIFNLVGQLISQGSFIETIDVSSLENGVYMLQVETEGQQFVKSFIKK